MERIWWCKTRFTPFRMTAGELPGAKNLLCKDMNDRNDYHRLYYRTLFD